MCAYALGITSIDPLRYNLLFERFLNPERVSMPDFDVDFCYIRRQEVIDYVARKYGNDHVAQIITFGTLAAKAAIKDVGRVMDLPYAKTDALSKMIPFGLNVTLSGAIASNPELRKFIDGDPSLQRLVENALKLEGMPRHASMHAAGIVITREPVTEYVPLIKNDGYMVTQYPMGTLERLGLLKMDFLGLRYLTVIQDCCKLVQKNNPGFDIEKIPENDAETYDMMSSGGTLGVFQFESSGMTSLLSRMKPRSVDDLDNGIIVVFQTVQNDLVPVPQIVGKAFAQCLIRFQHHAVHTREGHGFFTVFLFHSHTRFPILYTTNYFNSCPAPCQYR